MTTHSGLDTVIGGTGGKTANPEAAEQCYRKGQEFERAGDRVGACEQYRQAREHDSHDAATFRLAYLLDLLGEEDESMGLFDDMVRQPKPPLNALVNLAILHEDRGEYVRAERLLRQVLETEPNHRRALSFHKDVLASKEMFVDLDTEREKAGNAAVLDTPVTDFELSVRARNCLKKMNIRTLGDLLRISEAELLSYKNFGEQSLVEIKAMLTTKGLRLGQGLEGGKARRDILEQLRGTVPETVLNKPISSLELSVRARKALQLLGVATLGELASRTEAELLSYKNFGEQSLVEIKNMLQSKGLRLGQSLEGGKVRKDILDQLKSTVPENILSKPISALELSVRARKALQLLGVATLGELASRTEAELMGVKNFGQTSLVEIKEKLAQNGLRLRILE